MALPGMTEGMADALIAARAGAEPDPRNTYLLPHIPDEARRWLARGGGRIVYISARAETPEGGLFRREAVIELRPGARPPYITHAWHAALTAAE